MAKKTNYGATAIDMNGSTSEERECIELLKTLGKGKRAFLQTTLIYRFPEYFKTGEINDELADLIKKFSKPFVIEQSEYTAYFGWHINENRYDSAACELLNRKLGGGAKDFIVYILSSSHPLFFNTRTGPAVSKPVIEKKQEEEIVTTKKTAPSINDDNEIRQFTLDQFDDDDDDDDDEDELITGKYISRKKE